jgi:hypothetical protein
MTGITDVLFRRPKKYKMGCFEYLRKIEVIKLPQEAFHFVPVGR